MRRRTRIPFDQQKIEQSPGDEITLSGRTDFAGELLIEGKLVDLSNLSVGDRLIFDGQKFVFSKSASTQYSYLIVESEGQTDFDLTTLGVNEILNMWVNGAKQEAHLDYSFALNTLSFLETDFALSPSDRVQIEFI